MKTILKKIAFGVGFTILGLGLGLYGLAAANGEDLDLNQQLSELTLVLEKIFIPQEQGQEGSNDYLNGDLDQYSYWDEGVVPDCKLFTNPGFGAPTSNTYQATEWDLSFVARINQPGGSSQYRREMFNDLNGDGLIDYLYAQTSDPFHFLTCVFVNTGSSFEKAHACQGIFADNEWTYYGDCAAV